MTIEECEAMVKNGISTQVVHEIHGLSITCTLCQSEKEKIIKGH